MLTKNKTIFLVILFCLINAYCSYAESNIIFGKVIKVIDGDTIYIKHKDFGKMKVRLADIDAPELDQPYGKESKQLLKEIIDKKTIKLKKIAKDKYDRIIGVIYYKNLEINHYLVINGLAWCYDYYNQRIEIKGAENEAKQKKIAIWSSSKIPIAPWQWRKGIRNE